MGFLKSSTPLLASGDGVGWLALPAIWAVDCAMIGFGAWILKRGWGNRNHPEGVAYLVIGGIIIGVFLIPWAMVAWSFVPK